MERLKFTLLGGFETRLASTRLNLFGRKTQALLAYLAIRPGVAHSREKLATLLWGDTTDERARHSLRQALVSLRGHLPVDPAVLVEHGATVATNPAALDVDVVEFERLVAAGTTDALDRAVALYRGDLLEGVDAVQGEFEDWLARERSRLRELAVEALSRLLAVRTAEGSLDTAIHTGVRLLGLEPAHESVHRALMRLYVRQGRRAAALRQYQACVAALERELGAEPEPETKRLYQDVIRLGARPAVPVTSAPADADDVRMEASDSITGETPLVGRDAELTTLRAALDAARAGRGGITVVLGETGIGKSRLVASLGTEARDDDTVLIGRAYETERILPFGPWLSAFRDSGVLQGDVARDLERAWSAELARLFPEIGEGTPPPPPGPQDPARLFEAFAQLITRLAARSPLLLVLEDLHWADDMTLRLLAFVARRIHAARVLVVLTAREEDMADAPLLARVLAELDGERRLTRISVPLMSHEETDALVRALARAGSEPAAMAAVCARVWQMSQGNPFTAVEVMRAFASGRTGDAAERDASEALEVPDRVRSVIASRLNRLGLPAQELVAAAAVIGRAAEFRLLQRAARLGEREAAEAIEELVRRRVLHGVGEGFDFVHDRVRAVAYDQLLEPRRRTWQAAVAGALEDVYADRIDDVCDALAYHTERAGDAPRAVRFLGYASDKALRTYAVARAIGALERAVALVPQLPAGERDRWLLDLTIRQGFALSLVGRHRDIPALLLPHQERLVALDDPLLASAFHFRLALTISSLGDQKKSADHAQRALDEATRSGDAAATGRARYALALAVYIAGDLRMGARHARRAVADLGAANDRLYLGYAWWVLALAHYQLGDIAVARDAAREVDALGAALGDDKLRNFAGWTLGWIEAATGEADAAIETCRRAIELARDVYGRAQAVGFLGYAQLEKGDATAAIGLLEDAIRIFQQLRVPQMEGRFKSFLAEACLLAGDVGRAHEMAADSLRLTVGTQHAHGVGLAQKALGRVALARGARTDAERHLRDAFATFSSLGSRFEMGRTELALADVATARGDDKRAASHLDAARRIFVELDVPRYVERVDALGTRRRRGARGGRTQSLGDRS